MFGEAHADKITNHRDTERHASPPPLCGGTAPEEQREHKQLTNALLAFLPFFEGGRVGRRCRPTGDALVSAACAPTSVTP
jgi:hypothetical protein